MPTLASLSACNIAANRTNHMRDAVSISSLWITRVQRQKKPLILLKIERFSLRIVGIEDIFTQVIAPFSESRVSLSITLSTEGGIFNQAISSCLRISFKSLSPKISTASHPFKRIEICYTREIRLRINNNKKTTQIKRGCIF